MKAVNSYIVEDASSEELGLVREGSIGVAVCEVVFVKSNMEDGLAELDPITGDPPKNGAPDIELLMPCRHTYRPGSKNASKKIHSFVAFRTCRPISRIAKNIATAVPAIYRNESNVLTERDVFDFSLSDCSNNNAIVDMLYIYREKTIC